MIATMIYKDIASFTKHTYILPFPYTVSKALSLSCAVFLLKLINQPPDLVQNYATKMSLVIAINLTVQKMMVDVKEIITN